LIAQTFKDFEWVVVDDGSTDGVGALLAEYARRAPFTMKIIRQDNKGKHGAWNAALKVSEGLLFVPADSDDAFVPHALEFFRDRWLALGPDAKTGFSGINVLCKNAETGEITGDVYPNDGMVSNNLELAFKYRIRGEKWGCIQLALLKERPFPEVNGSFFTENYLWFQLAKAYQVVCYNEPLRTYFTSEQNRVSNLTSRDVRNAHAKYEYFQWQFKNKIVDYLAYGRPLLMIKDLIRYVRYGIHAGVNLAKLAKGMPALYFTLILILVFPMKVLLLMDKAFKRKLTSTN
jgi:glycosyltransferase involved in cell wall biosynthesis